MLKTLVDSLLVFLCAFRKASLALIRKMVHYSSEVLLKEVCDSETGHNLPTVLVEITATVLDQEVHTHTHTHTQLSCNNPVTKDQKTQLKVHFLSFSESFNHILQSFRR